MTPIKLCTSVICISYYFYFKETKLMMLDKTWRSSQQPPWLFTVMAMMWPEELSSWPIASPWVLISEQNLQVCFCAIFKLIHDGIFKRNLFILFCLFICLFFAMTKFLTFFFIVLLLLFAITKFLTIFFIIYIFIYWFWILFI